MTRPLLQHGACVAIGEKAVLLLGKPGSGKSSLALRLIDRGADLIADDQVELTQENERIFAQPPSSLAGLIEARGIGIMTLPYRRQVALHCVVRLAEQPDTERLPEPQFFDCLSVRLPLHSLWAFDPATDVKIRLILNA